MPKNPAKPPSPKRARATRKAASEERKAKPRANAKATKAMVKTATKISNADRRHAEELLTKIERRKQSISEDFYDIGEALRDLLHKKLYVALGYSSFDEMLSARNVMSRSQAHKLIAVVAEMPREKALAVGPEKAAMLIRYAEATPEVDTAEWLLDKGTMPDGKPVADTSTRELKEASKRARARSGKKTAQIAQTERDARDVQAILRKLGAKGAIAKPLRRAGEDWLQIELLAATAKELFAGRS